MGDDTPILEFSDASIESRGSLIPGKLKLSDQGITFKNSKTGKTEDIKADSLEVVNWQRLAGSYGLRIFTTKGHLFRFGGFKESDQVKLSKFVKNNYKKSMSDKEYSVKGWNYGAAKFEGSILSFDIGSTSAFEIPLNNVSSCITGKNEVTMEFHQHDDTPVAMMEMRFHIPTNDLAGDDDPVEEFRKRVMSEASVITATGDALAIFREIQCLTPRGRYDIKVYPSFIQLHGKTYDFKIPIDTVQRLFLMPHQDQRQHFFVVAVDPPIKQGQTRYPYIILLFSGDDDDTIELPLSEEELKEKYEGRLEKEISGPQFEVLGRLFKGLCNRKIVTPGNFLGHTGTPAVSCSYKAAAGYLYPMERGFLYIHKPPIYIRFDEISSINFARSGSTTRSFDIEIELRNGTMNTFSSIDKGEYSRLYDFANGKKLRMKNKKEMESFGRTKDYGDGKEPDHYMNRVRAEAQERDDDDDDLGEEEESEDSDFNPDAGEGSDVAEEYDSNASDSSDESDASGEGGEKKKKEKSPKKDKPKKARTVSEKPRKPKKAKQEKDENRPKRPQSAYFLWLADHREQIKSENPGFSITDVSKRAGEMWRELTDKTKWEEKAAEEKKKYEIAMKEYIASGGAASSGGGSKSGKTKKPKGAASKTASPTKAGSGVGFKSKEYISDSSSDDEDEKPSKKVKSEPKSKEEKAGKKKKEESEEEMDDASEEEEAESSAASSGGDDDE